MESEFTRSRRTIVFPSSNSVNGVVKFGAGGMFPNLSGAHSPQRLKPGSIFAALCGTAEAVPFPSFDY